VNLPQKVCEDLKIILRSAIGELDKLCGTCADKKNHEDLGACCSKQKHRAN
jgi:hypothetical protein